MRTPENGKEAEQRRLRALVMVQKGLSSATIGQRLGVDPRTVRRWKEIHHRKGAAGLRTQRAPGRKCRLSRRQRNCLARRLLGGALAQGFSTDLWTCPRIAELIQEQYGVSYHVDHIPRLMASLGFSAQKPERRARQRDEKAIQAWIERSWPRLKKRPSVSVAGWFSSTKPGYF